MNIDIEKITPYVIGGVVGIIAFDLLTPKPKARRSQKEIALLKNKSEEKGYLEGYKDGKKDFKRKKKK